MCMLQHNRRNGLSTLRGVKFDGDINFCRRRLDASVDVRLYETLEDCVLCHCQLDHGLVNKPAK